MLYFPRIMYLILPKTNFFLGWPCFTQTMLSKFIDMFKRSQLKVMYAVKKCVSNSMPIEISDILS